MPGQGDNSKIQVSQISLRRAREALAGALSDGACQYLVLDGRRKLLIRAPVASVDWQLNLLLDRLCLSATKDPRGLFC